MHQLQSSFKSSIQKNNFTINSISEHKSETQNEEEERSLHKRQLDFDGGGGGVNRYVNGDHDYEDYEDYDIEYWTQVMGK